MRDEDKRRIHDNCKNLALVTSYSSLSLRTKKARLTDLKEDKKMLSWIPVEHPSGVVPQASGH